MRIRIRLFIIIVAIVASGLLLGAAVLAGHGIPTVMAVVQLADPGSESVTYGLIDIDRGIVRRRSILVPGFAGVRFTIDPPLVLQVASGDGIKNWTLSALDVATGTLTTETRIETAVNVQLAVSAFRKHVDGGWSIHDFETGNLYYADGGSANARLVRSVSSPVAIWSRDMKRLAVSIPGMVEVTNADGGEPVMIAYEAETPLNNIRWSLDGRHVTLYGSSADSAMLVADTHTGEIAASLSGHAPQWCGGDLMYVTDTGDAVYEARLHDLDTGREEVLLTRDLSDRPIARRTLTVSGLNRDTCDWLMIWIGNEPYELWHRQSGALIPFGNDMQFEGLDLTDTALTYLVSTTRTTELRRIRLDPTVTSYEVLTVLDRFSTSLTWIDDVRGGLYLRLDTLVHIDADSGAQTALAGPDVQTFYLMP
jgi:hypothetical protein